MMHYTFSKIMKNSAEKSLTTKKPQNNIRIFNQSTPMD